MRMQNSQLSSAVDRRRLTLLSDAVPGVVPASTCDIGSVDGAGGPVAEDIGDAVAGADAAVQADRRWWGGRRLGHSMASIAFRLIGRIVSGT